MNLFRRIVVTSVATGALAIGGAAPLHADPPPINIGHGLVNVQIAGVDVDVPISVAANLCDINAAVLVGEFRDDGTADCEATAETIASPGSHAGGVNVGGGLVNVQIAGLDIAVPVGVAANLCDVNAAVLVGEFHDTGEATCEATAESIAS